MATSFDITKIQNPVIKEIWAGQEKYLVEKYQKPGIYCVKVNNKIVYIGKSNNMLGRLYDHLRSIEGFAKQEQKYKILRQLKEAGYTIKFEVMQSQESYDKDSLGELEGEYIRQYNPILNSQIPIKGNYHSWTTRKIPSYNKVVESL